MLIKSLGFFASFGLLVACSASRPETSEAPQSTTPDASVTDEFGQLPEAVVIAVQKDRDGKELTDTAELRSLASQDLNDADAVAKAFGSGGRVESLASDDTSGTEQSAQSWVSYKGKQSYLSYQPQVYSKVNPKEVYSYTQPQAYATESTNYYVYRRPSCRGRACNPAPGIPGNGNPGPLPPGKPAAGDPDSVLVQALAKYGIVPLKGEDFKSYSPEMVALGERLFNDPLLSAYNDIACATCHSERLGTTSRYSLSPSGEVLGRRKQGPFSVSDLLGRNTPALYNLGHNSFSTMFWDSRVARDSSHPQGFRTPAAGMLPVGLDSVLAAQALFPLVGAAEMGCTGLSGDQSLDSVTQWGNITSRVLQRADYVNMLGLAYPQLAKGQYTIAHVANAIAAFEAVKWRADNSAFDRFLKGDRAALTPKQKQGATYFLGKGQCASCHAGPLLTDHGHHAIGVPQFGPGNGDGIGGHEDFGYGRTTGRDEDAFKFRTPSLRNVAVTAPYGHNGAYATLKEMVYHYTRPQVPRWNLGQVHLAPGYQAQPIAGAWDDAASRANIAARSEVKAIPLSAQEVDALVDFLYSLTDAEIGRVNDARR